MSIIRELHTRLSRLSWNDCESGLMEPPPDAHLWELGSWKRYEPLSVTLSALLSLITQREMTDRNGIRLIRSWRSVKCWRTLFPRAVWSKMRSNCDGPFRFTGPDL